MRVWAVILAGAMGLAACGGGQRGGALGALFGPSAEARVAAPARAPVVDQVLSLSAAPTPGGVIVSAVGLPPTQGYWAAELVRVPSADPGLYLMEFRILPPAGPQPVGAQPTREVLGGTFLSLSELAGVRTIAVQGLRSSRTVTRQ